MFSLSNYYINNPINTGLIQIAIVLIIIKGEFVLKSYLS